MREGEGRGCRECTISSTRNKELNSKTPETVPLSVYFIETTAGPQPVLPDPIRLLGWNHSVVGPEDGSNISQMAEQEDVSLVCLETSAWWPKEVEGEGGEGSG